MSPRIADDLHVQWIDDEAVVLNASKGTLHYLNQSAALLYALIEEHGFPDAIEKLKEVVTGPGVEEDIPLLIDQMIEEGLLLPD